MPSEELNRISFTPSPLTSATRGTDSTSALMFSLLWFRGPPEPVAADINGDGKPEVIFASSTANAAGTKTGVDGSLYVVDGSGKLLTKHKLHSAIYESGPTAYDNGAYAAPTVADIDGDGKPEILVKPGEEQEVEFIACMTDGSFDLSITMGAMPEIHGEVIEGDVYLKDIVLSLWANCTNIKSPGQITSSA